MFAEYKKIKEQREEVKTKLNEFRNDYTQKIDSKLVSYEGLVAGRYATSVAHNRTVRYSQVEELRTRADEMRKYY